MKFLDQEIQAYAERHTGAETDLLRRIDRETHLQVLRPRMLSGHLQGRILSMFAKMHQPNSILEIGTYTGYSAVCLAEGLAPGGTLTTIDINDLIEERVRGYLTEAGIADQVQFLIGNALEIIPELTGPFDMVFIDADKVNYPAYYEMVLDKMPAGGILMADNVLWSGKVVEPLAAKDKDTEALLKFNKQVQDDPRVENVLVPIRDGIMMARKL